MTTILSRLGTVAAACLAVGWFVLLRPVALGGSTTYEIVSGTSMEPRLHTGDLVIAHAESSYQVGEVVVYRVPADQLDAGSVIVHRIVGGDGTGGFIVMGDNKPAPDPWHPKTSDIVGRSWIELPGTGRLLLVVRTPLVLATVVGGLAGFWFLTSGSKTRPPRNETGRGLRSRIARRTARPQREPMKP
jgi:signal peptidase I